MLAISVSRWRTFAACSTSLPGREQPCASVDAIAETHLAAIDAKIASLKALRGEITGPRARCESSPRPRNVAGWPAGCPGLCPPRSAEPACLAVSSCPSWGYDEPGNSPLRNQLKLSDRCRRGTCRSPVRRDGRALMAVVQEVDWLHQTEFRTWEAAPLAGSILDKSASRSHISFKRWTNIVRIALTLPNKRLTANGWIRVLRPCLRYRGY